MIVPAFSMVAKHPAAGPGLYPVRSEQGFITCVISSAQQTEHGCITCVVTRPMQTQQGVATGIITGVSNIDIRLVNQGTKVSAAQGNPVTHEEVTHS